MTVACARCDATGQGTPAALPAGWVETPSATTGTTFLVCPACAGRRATPASTGDVAGDRLRLFIERIERIEEELRGLADDRKDIYAEAKAVGYDVRTIREIVKLRRMDAHARQEAEALLETYKASLGME